LFSYVRWEGSLTPYDSITALAEGLQRLYGDDASLLIRQFAAENARVGDAVSAAFWSGIALAIANPKTLRANPASEP
jgi:hypothetical protein